MFHVCLVSADSSFTNFLKFSVGQLVNVAQTANQNGIIIMIIDHILCRVKCGVVRQNPGFQTDLVCLFWNGDAESQTKITSMMINTSHHL